MRNHKSPPEVSAALQKHNPPLELHHRKCPPEVGVDSPPRRSKQRGVQLAHLSMNVGIKNDDHANLHNRCFFGSSSWST